MRISDWSSDVCSADLLEPRERAALADVEAWPRTVKREAAPSAPADKALNIVEGERSKAEKSEPAPSRADAPSKTANQDKKVEDTTLALPSQIEREYLRVGDDLFRSGRDEKPDMSITGQHDIERKIDEKGQSGSVRVDLGCPLIINKKPK